MFPLTTRRHRTRPRTRPRRRPRRKKQDQEWFWFCNFVRLFSTWSASCLVLHCIVIVSARGDEDQDQDQHTGRKKNQEPTTKDQESTDLARWLILGDYKSSCLVLFSPVLFSPVLSYLVFSKTNNKTKTKQVEVLPVFLSTCCCCRRCCCLSLLFWKERGRCWVSVSCLVWLSSRARPYLSCLVMSCSGCLSSGPWPWPWPWSCLVLSCALSWVCMLFCLPVY